MDLTIRIKSRWVRLALIVVVTALVAFPIGVMASDRFDDVPDSNTFHDDIAAIADAEVTRGCNPPANTLYCPDDFVTREQMAAFMNRLGNLDGESTPSVDATTLDGNDSTELAPIVFAQNDPAGTGNSVTVSADDRLVINSLDIEVPTDGFLVYSGSVFVNNDSVTPVGYIVIPRLDGDDIVAAFDAAEGGWSALFTAAATGDDVAERFTLAYTATTPVEAGTHTVSQLLGPFEDTADLFYNKQQLTVTFIPAGEVSPAGTAGTSTGDSGSGAG